MRNLFFGFGLSFKVRIGFIIKAFGFALSGLGVQFCHLQLFFIWRGGGRLHHFGNFEDFSQNLVGLDLKPNSRFLF